MSYWDEHRYGGNNVKPCVVQGTLDAQDKQFELHNESTDKIAVMVMSRAKRFDKYMYLQRTTKYWYSAASTQKSITKSINRNLRERYDMLRDLACPPPVKEVVEAPPFVGPPEDYSWIPF